MTSKPSADRHEANRQKAACSCGGETDAINDVKRLMADEAAHVLNRCPQITHVPAAEMIPQCRPNDPQVHVRTKATIALEFDAFRWNCPMPLPGMLAPK
jgi:hypothetical protein